jgi:hypothetical protein
MGKENREYERRIPCPGIPHHDQVSVPQIAEHALRLHEPLRIIACVVGHDLPLEIIRVEQPRVCDELVLGIHLERDVRGWLDAHDARERDAAVCARGDETLHAELPPSVGEDRAKRADKVTVERRRWRRGTRHAAPERNRRGVRAGADSVARQRALAFFVCALAAEVLFRNAQWRFCENGRMDGEWVRGGYKGSVAVDNCSGGSWCFCAIPLHVRVAVVRKDAKR